MKTQQNIFKITFENKETVIWISSPNAIFQILLATKTLASWPMGSHGVSGSNEIQAGVQKYMEREEEADQKIFPICMTRLKCETCVATAVAFVLRQIVYTRKGNGNQIVLYSTEHLNMQSKTIGLKLMQLEQCTYIGHICTSVHFILCKFWRKEDKKGQFLFLEVQSPKKRLTTKSMQNLYGVQNFEMEWYRELPNILVLQKQSIAEEIWKTIIPVIGKEIIL